VTSVIGRLGRRPYSISMSESSGGTRLCGFAFMTGWLWQVDGLCVTGSEVDRRPYVAAEPTEEQSSHSPMDITLEASNKCIAIL